MEYFMMTQKVKLRLSNMPDSYGFFYGTVENLQGSVRQVNVLPPAHQWAGQTRLDGYEPDPCYWSIYLDGELFAKAKRVEQIETVIAQTLN